MKRRILLVAALALFGWSTAQAAGSGARCFTRAYTAEHMARHPDQLVTRVDLGLYPAPKDAAHRTFFKLRVALRGRAEPLYAKGACNGGRCLVECDRGGIEFNERTGIMRLDRVRMTAACESDDINAGEEITGGLDDRVFRLDQVACREDQR